jgi:hypothetical protein
MRAVDINDDLGWEQSSDFNIAPARVVPKRGKNNRKNWDKWYAKPDNKIWHSCRLPFYLTHTHIIHSQVSRGCFSTEQLSFQIFQIQHVVHLYQHLLHFAGFLEQCPCLCCHRLSAPDDRDRACSVVHVCFFDLASHPDNLVASLISIATILKFVVNAPSQGTHLGHRHLNSQV